MQPLTPGYTLRVSVHNYTRHVKCRVCHLEMNRCNGVLTASPNKKPCVRAKPKVSWHEHESTGQGTLLLHNGGGYQSNVHSSSLSKCKSKILSPQHAHDRYFHPQSRACIRLVKRSMCANLYQSPGILFVLDLVDVELGAFAAITVRRRRST